MTAQSKRHTATPCFIVPALYSIRYIATRSLSDIIVPALAAVSCTYRNLLMEKSDCANNCPCLSIRLEK